MFYKFSLLSLASAGALSFFCASADAQGLPEFYAGIGGGYSLGPDRYAPALNGSASSERFDFGEVAPFGYVGARIPFNGIFVGLEAEYMRRGTSDNDTLNYPGFQDEEYGTIGAYSASFRTRLLDRASISAVVSVPIGKFEGYFRAGLAYSGLAETYSKNYRGPAGYSAICFPPDFECTVTYYFANSINVKQSKNMASPVLATGIQFPLGSLFARLEAEVEFLSLPPNRLSFTQTYRPAEGISVSPSRGFISAWSGAGVDANLRLSASIGARF